MKKNNSIIYYLIIFIFALIFIFIYIEINYPTPNEVDIYETILINLVTGSLVSLLLSYIEYISCREEQDSIFLSRTFNYYIWLKQFKNNVEEIKKSGKFNLIYDEYNVRLELLKKEQKQNDIYYYGRYLDLFELEDVTSGLEFIKIKMEKDCDKKTKKNAFEVLHILDNTIEKEINIIDSKINKIKPKRIKKEWNYYKKMCLFGSEKL